MGRKRSFWLFFLCSRKVLSPVQWCFFPEHDAIFFWERLKLLNQTNGDSFANVMTVIYVSGIFTDFPVKLMSGLLNMKIL